MQQGSSKDNSKYPTISPQLSQIETNTATLKTCGPHYRYRYIFV